MLPLRVAAALTLAMGDRRPVTAVLLLALGAGLGPSLPWVVVARVLDVAVGVVAPRVHGRGPVLALELGDRSLVVGHLERALTRSRWRRWPCPPRS